MTKQVVVMTMEQKDAMVRTFTDLITFINTLSVLPLQETGNEEVKEEPTDK